MELQSWKMRDDLRSFLRFVRQQAPREYLRIDNTVSPHWEIAATIAMLEGKKRMPIVEFPRVSGCAMPVVANVCASLPRIARSLNITPVELENRLLHAYENPISPQVWERSDSPPVRECVTWGSEVDLYSLPQLRSSQHEEAGFLSAAAVIARDPLTGIANVSYHRLMIADRCRTTIYMTPSGHLNQIFQTNASQDRPTPVIVFIGAHPLWALGSLAAGDIDVDELAVIGGLLGYPLEITPSLINAGLPVPARAEIALEGIIHHRQTMQESPYGEALGFVSAAEPRPVLEVKVMSTRKNPIFQEVVAGHIEHLNMTGTAVKIHLHRTLTHKYPQVAEIHQAGPMTLYLRLTRDVNRADMKNLMREVLGNQRYVKQVVIFDHDVDLRNSQQVNRALATMVQADKDILILPDQLGNGIDPSECNGKTTKWGIDATTKPTEAGVPARSTIPQTVLDKILRQASI